MRSCTLEVFREVNRRKQICFHIVINHLKRKRQKKQLKTLFQFSYERVISLLTVKRLEIPSAPIISQIGDEEKQMDAARGSTIETI